MTFWRSWWPSKPASSPPESQLVPQKESLSELLAKGKSHKRELGLKLCTEPVSSWHEPSLTGDFFGALLSAKEWKLSFQETAEMFAIALYQGAMPASENQGAVIEALMAGCDDQLWPFVKLIEQGANPGQELPRGKTWIYCALEKGLYGLGSLLMKHGASLEEKKGLALDHAIALAFMAQREKEEDYEDAAYMGYFDFYEGLLPHQISASEHFVLLNIPFADTDLRGDLHPLVEELLALGQDINAPTPSGHTAYGLACPEQRGWLKSRGAHCWGNDKRGYQVFFQLMVQNQWGALKEVLLEDPLAFQRCNADGSLAALAWWALPPDTASQAIGWFKEHQVWERVLSAVDQNGRNFLTGGLKMILEDTLNPFLKGNLKASGNPDKQKKAFLEGRLARLETEIHSSMWVDPDEKGETVNFWLSTTGHSNLLSKYVLPRRERLLRLVLDRVDQQTDHQTANARRRARL